MKKFSTFIFVILQFIAQISWTRAETLLSHSKNAEQSSTYYGNVASRGNDANLATMFHTNKKLNNWWRVDLGQVCQVTKVYFFNRKEATASRLKNLRVSVGYDKHTLKSCAFYPGPGQPGTHVELICEAVGRVVYLTQEINEYFHLTEVLVFGNTFEREQLISQNAKTKQSSTYDSRFVSANGVDGVRNNMFHTLEEANSFWAVDLGKVYKLERVYIFNRKDAQGQRLTDLEVLVGREENALSVCGTYKGPGVTGDEFQIGCNSYGRHVYLKQKAKQFLHLAEVQVFGSEIPDLLLSQDQLSTQSSNYNNMNMYGPAFGNDGNLNNMFHTKSALNNFWSVDLGQYCTVKRIHLVNRKDGSGHRLRNLRISVGKDVNSLKECAYYQGPSQTGAEHDLACNEIGKMVYLKMEANDYFHLNEVQVYGTPLRIDVLLSRHKKSSMNLPDNMHFAIYGNDGNLNSRFQNTHSRNNFWSVDLEAEYQITRVYLVNRKDKFGERLRNLRILVGKTLSSLKECAYYKGPSYTGEEIELICNGIGQIVYLRSEVHDYFHLNEVEVFGTTVGFHI